MSKQFSRSLILLTAVIFVMCGFFVAGNASAAIKTAVASGNWNTGATWNGGTVPATGDDVVIDGGFTVTIAAAPANNPYGSLTIGGATAGTLTILPAATANYTLTITNNVTVNGNGNFTVGNLAGADNAHTVNIGGNLTVDGTFNMDSANDDHATVVFNGSAQQTISGVGATCTFFSLTDSNTSTNGLVLGRNITLTPTTTLTTTLTVTAGDVFDLGSYTANRSVAGAGTITVNGTLKIGGTGTFPANYTTNTLGAASTVEYNGTTQTVRDMAYTGNLTINGGNKTWALGAGRTVGGILTIGSGSLTTSGNQTFGVTGATNVTGTLNLGGTSAKTFTGNVTINPGGDWEETGASTYSFAGNLQNDGIFTANTGVHTFTTAAKTFSGTNGIAIPSVTISGTRTNNGTLTVSTALAGASALTNGATGVLNIGGTSTITTLTATAGGNTVNYTGAGQTVNATAYYNLILSGSGAKIMPAGTSVGVGGNLSVAPTGSATASIAVGQNLTVDSLSIGGFGRINGTWGSSSSPATYIDDTYFAPTTGYLTVTTDIRSATLPTFSGLASPSAGYGTTVILTGVISAAGPIYPINGETSVSAKINGNTQSGTVINGTGGFSISYDLGTTPVSAIPYTVTYSYAGGGNLRAALDDTSTTITVGKATPTLSVTNSPVDYDGSTHSATVSGSVAGTVSHILTGGATSQLNANSYTVTANFLPTDTVTYNTLTGASTVNNFIISKATPILSVTNSPVDYDGTPKSATVSTSPHVAGIISNILTGVAATQIDANTYAVTANFAPSDPSNYKSLTDGPAGNFIINMIDQAALTLTGLPTNANYGDTGITAGTSGGSGTGAVTYHAGASTACSIDLNSGAVTITSGTGDCTITATKADDINYNEVTSDPVSIIIGKIDQIALTVMGLPASAVYNQAGVTAGTVGGSGTGVVTYSAGASTACLIDLNSGAVTIFNGIGDCTITATKAADDSYYEATSAPVSITIGKADQTITVTGLPSDATYGDTGITAGNAGSLGTGEISYSAGASTACSIDSSLGAVTILSGTGDCSITATITADANYNEATSAPVSITIHKADPVLSVNNSPATYDGAPHSATVSGSVAGTPDNILTGGSASQLNVGSYTVTADFTPYDTTDYNILTGASCVNTFDINQIEETLSVTNSPVTYNGSPQAAIVTDDVSGTVSDIKYDGSSTVPTDADTYAVTADFAPDDTINYINLNDAPAGNFVIDPFAVVLAGTREYDGTPTADAAILSVANKIGLDDVTVASGSGTLASAAIGVQSIADFGMLALGGAQAGNYTFTGGSGSVTIKPSTDATLKASSTVKGQTIDNLGTPNGTLGAETAGAVNITSGQAADITGGSPYITLFDRTNAAATVDKVVKYATGDSTANFETTDPAYANEAITDQDFFIVKVTAADTTTVLYYKIVVTIAPYATAPSAIDLTVGAGGPVGGVTNVHIPAEGGTDTNGAVTGWVSTTNDTIAFTVTDAGGTSTITIDGEPYPSGSDYAITSTSDLTIVVTTTEAAKTTAVRTFTVTVAAAPYATAPSAIDLTVGSTNPVGGVTNVHIPAEGGTDTNGAVIGWVTATHDKIKFTVTDAGGSSAITINTLPYTSGNDYTIASTADQTIVVTTTETGKTPAVRTFTVTVAAAGGDATLSALNISFGTLTPAFAKGTISYTDSVGNAVTSVTVTPTRTQAGATITVNGTPVASGVASGAIALSVGSGNTINVVVTAEDTVTTKTYTITVTRASGGGPGGGGGGFTSSNGACGIANNASYYSIPTTNLCSVGNPSAVAGSGPWTWTCSGLSGGSASPACTANKSANLPDGCTSTSGYSITTGLLCSGAALTAPALPAGCTSTSGYSITTGQPCSGGKTTTFPQGCTSTSGYSITTGQSCSGGTTTTTSSITVIFTKLLTYGMTDPQVKSLQIFLNAHGFPVAMSGAGSLGHETNYFGPATLKAVQAFQVHYNIAGPGIVGYGLVGPKTRQMLNQLNQ